ncbi:MAG: polysaccharide deacetylase family protein [Hyphomicrobium sp.]|nr:polysaccharide deacetylase family protein [Hyphomicrobium sp.]
MTFLQTAIRALKVCVAITALASAESSLAVAEPAAQPAPVITGSTGESNAVVETAGSAAAGPLASPPPPSFLPPCAASQKTLGVSRVVEIEAHGGPHLGGSHGGRIDFLEKGEVVLTFDDGPMRAYTRRVLKALADECTLATFFMVGRMAVADPAMVREVAAAGHTIGSHTWSHKNLGAVNLALARREFEMGVTAVAKANGNKLAPFFRFPYLSAGHAAKAMVQARDFATFWIDVDSKDYMSRNPSDVHKRVMSQLAVTGKGIILFHDIQPSTVKALPGLLAEMRAKGYKVVHAMPSGDAATVADYEGDVAKAFAARSKASASTPLADRSVVWSAVPNDAGSAAGSGADLPWSEKPKSAARRPASKPAAPKSEQLPWQNQIF